MKAIVVGLGVQGNKRAAIAERDLVATVDTVNPKARYRDVREVPLDSYQCAFVCTPDGAKFEVLSYLLSNGKHVLVEKPLLAENSSELVKLSELAKANRAVCYTAYNHRFEPHIVNLKKTIDAGVLGQIHLARFFYGNGTARDVRNSAWRDQGDGVLPDLGSHLLDTTDFLFGKPKGDFRGWSFDRLENKSYDHVLFGHRGHPVIELEATLLSWRNTFTADVYGELGSAHIFCLCKWGPSTYTVRKRVLPSGRPVETTETLEMKDPTWQAEYEHFVSLCRTGGTNLDNDIWINDQLNKLGEFQ